MSIWHIAWRSIRQRALASSLTSFSMALGVLLVTAVLLVHGLVSKSFSDNSDLGYNMIAGAKGGKLQVVLNTTFYLSEPVENIPYTFYQEFLTKEQQEKELSLMAADKRGELTDGTFAKNTEFAIPVCLGDYYQNYRVVGTLPKFFESFKDENGEDLKYHFEEGRNFETWNDEHGYFEAVVGSVVAQQTGLKVGDQIAASHGGDPTDIHTDSPFTVVGILEPSGTPNDRAVFINMEGFYLMSGHAKVKEDEEVGADIEGSTISRRQPLPIQQREVTAVLIRTSDPFSPIIIRNRVNEGNVAQIVMPVMEITSLFDLIVKPIQMLLLVITMLICVVSGISILVSIYNSMNDRKRDIAVMRALGARRETVMGIVLWESIILSVGGGILGWMGAHVLLFLVSPSIEAQTGVRIGLFDLAPLPRSLEVQIPSVIIDNDWLGPLCSLELVIVPALILLAVIVGFLPAYTAYRTDVAEALSSSP
ncbi:ABC transporter permease [Blastopirellula marina]|uniref:ABC transporter permease n=1 Tax=Blastopirellula marina TaxID=124 RepID=A0A2S8FPI4_9BACT|nr:ABC transporter permease [Blastopirellula marina]PQO33920.1 ABC transporter permease [Blastopirellula marina]PTL43706.1 ABC transporter permease [Blastopirellula marina]